MHVEGIATLPKILLLLFPEPDKERRLIMRLWFNLDSVQRGLPFVS
jgi:hypothetical protein